MKINFLEDLAVWKKLALGFGIVLTALAVVSISSFNSFGLLAERMAKLEDVARLSDNAMQARQDEKNFIIRGDTEAYSNAKNLAERIADRASMLRQDFSTPATVTALQQVESSAEIYQTGLSELAQQTAEQAQLRDTMEQRSRTAVNAIRDAEAGYRQQLEQLIQASGDGQSIRALARSAQASDLGAAMLELRRLERTYTAQPTDENYRRIEAALAQVQQIQQALLSTTNDTNDRQNLQASIDDVAAYARSLERYVDISAAATTTESNMTSAARDLMANVDTVLAGQRAEIATAEAEVEMIIWAFSLAAFALGIGAAVVTTRLIVRPLNEAVAVANTVASGDLTVEMDSNRKDELGKLMQAMGRMTRNLRKLMRELTQSIEQIAAASEELSAVTEETANGVRQQQADTDQVATAMNEMSATVLEVARNAESAANAAGESDTHAKNGYSVVSNTIDQVENLESEIRATSARVGELRVSTENIGTVLDVISGIAEQTNLLALNAAIEAARAGESGRGFSVVADEVRNLAQRTQESTQQIESLIDSLQKGAQSAVVTMESSIKLTDQTVEVAKQAGAALQQITASVSSIQEMNAQIATAAEEQSKVAEDINTSVLNIRDVAEQAAAASVQTSSASHELASLAGDLKALVGKFKFERSGQQVNDLRSEPNHALSTARQQLKQRSFVSKRDNEFDDDELLPNYKEEYA